MKHQQQGRDECKLATMAMLADVPIAEVREIACKASGVTNWEETTGNGAEYFVGVKAVLQKWPITNVLDSFCNSLDQWIATGHAREIQPKELTIDILSGRGELFIHWKLDASHSVAYEKGVIYDPNESKPLSLTAWQTKHGHMVRFYLIRNRRK